MRGIDAYLKVGTVRHRTTLVRHDKQTVGVGLYEDVEPIDLDHTLDDLPRTRDFLGTMLDAMGKQCGINSVADQYFNPNALEDLTLASGGVARDFLTIFVEAVQAARAARATKWLTPKYIYKGALRVSYRTKLTNLREDLGGEAEPLALVFVDLLEFCLHDKKKTVFLISQDDTQSHPKLHDLIKQLMDFRLIHIVEPDTSAASGRLGRYEAYTLDFSTFMEPRRRGIEVVKFWEMDDAHRRVGLREAPVYSLARVDAVLARTDAPGSDEILSSVERQLRAVPAVESGETASDVREGAATARGESAGLFDNIDKL